MSSSFEEIMNAEMNADLAAAFTAGEKDFDDAEALRGAAFVDVAEVDATDTIGSVSSSGDALTLAYREGVNDNNAYLVFVVNGEVVWMGLDVATGVVEWLQSRITRAAERGRS